jgi:hypothetical protein
MPDPRLMAVSSSFAATDFLALESAAFGGLGFVQPPIKTGAAKGAF